MSLDKDDQLERDGEYDDIFAALRESFTQIGQSWQEAMANWRNGVNEMPSLDFTGLNRENWSARRTATQRELDQVEQERSALLESLARLERKRAAIEREQQFRERLRATLDVESTNFDAAILEEGAVIRWVKRFRDRVTNELADRRYTYVAVKVDGLWYASGYSSSVQGRRGREFDALVRFMLEHGEVESVEIASGFRSLV